MDSEAAVIRSEMSQTRAELDRKITRLESRARQMTPRRMAQRHLPEFFLDRVIGGALTLMGVRMAWHHYRNERRARRYQVRTASASYARW